MKETDKSSYVKAFARVILPLKLRGVQTYTYRIPELFRELVEMGSRVTVQVVNIKYIGVICDFLESPDIEYSKIRPILSVEPYPVIRTSELLFWRQMADYYMCTIGEVYAAACPATLRPKKRKCPETSCTTVSEEKSGTSEENGLTLDSRCVKPLTVKQSVALENIRSAFILHKTVLLNGVTGSGKTELYIHLITDTLKSGRNVLFLLPEKAVSRQLVHRLSKVFADAVMVFHSGVSPARRKELISFLSRDDVPPRLVIGLRSAVFLPFANLGLTIVDEEHDSSYKQYDPAPRYHGRDAALMLSAIHSADVLLGSATPSFESCYNVETGKYIQVILDEKFNSAPEPIVTIVDMNKKKRERALKGSISFVLRDAVQSRLDSHEQVIVFRSRRAYAPAVGCSLCGDIPHCPNCNTALTYHKFSASLKCHYCGYAYSPGSAMKCPVCGEGVLEPMGAGTERIEEELREMFPQAVVARYDADTFQSVSEGNKILKSFAEGGIDILVGTQMISKGFDFRGLTLAAVIQGESLLGLNDFRADEKALQLLTQLRGRVGRREKQGEMIIQTSLAGHPVFRLNEIGVLLRERAEFGFPPYTRMIDITVKDRIRSRLDETSGQIKKILSDTGITDFDGPVPPPTEKQQGEYIHKFTIRLKRNRASESKKRLLMERISLMERDVVINVDPL